MLRAALRGGYAVGAFNIYNMETLRAVIDAARELHSPVILAVSESALEYMGGDMLISMIAGAKIRPHEQIALHLDHGHSYESCVRAINMGFSSVMIDASNLPFHKNIALSARVVQYAHRHNVSVESELGALRGFEDENTKSKIEQFTRPNDVVEFVSETGTDSIAIAIGTSHGAYKRKSDTERLRFDILSEIAKKLPNFPLVLHGASNIPVRVITKINKNGGKIIGAHGIPVSQLRRAISMHVCKINIDSDNRLAFTAGVREFLQKHPENFNPREYLGMGTKLVHDNTATEINEIMNSGNRY
jgi:fructose-bisphosphate aldolase class II